MAVPDPHMEELDIVTYDARPRACKETNRIPRRSDFIDVIWCLDHLPGQPERWCTAEVLYLTGTPAQEVFASGVIRYVSGESWDEEIHTVEFLKDHKVRRTINDGDEQGEYATSENPHPVMDWHFAKERQRSSAPSDDKDWMDDRGYSAEAQTRWKRKKSPFKERHRSEIDSIRTGYAALSVELEKVKRELLNHTYALRTLKSDTLCQVSCSSAGCVLQRLLHRLGLKMQAGLRPMSSILGKRSAATRAPVQQDKIRTGIGLHVDSLRVRVECTLQQFEHIARQIKSSPFQQQVFFVPDFSYTQFPSKSSSAFRVMFCTFHDLASFIGITSLSDLMEMARKCGTGPEGDILRILGTYQQKKNSPSSAASMFLGTSCGTGSETTNNSGTPNYDVTNSSYPILERQSVELKKVDRRFTNPLCLKQRKLPVLGEGISKAEAFAMEWKRASELGSRT